MWVPVPLYKNNFIFRLPYVSIFSTLLNVFFFCFSDGNICVLLLLSSTVGLTGVNDAVYTGAAGVEATMTILIK